MLNPKIADHHLMRKACIYIRQSTMAQVRFNQESTERQYNLADQAKSLGWMPEQIRILDRDLAQSGELTTKRDDFKTLVSDVAMGQVGAIFSLESSRLARSNKDWHRLLELCAVTKTLVFDGDGCYDPSDFNDSLVLGIKGTSRKQNCTSFARASTAPSSIERRKVSCVAPGVEGTATEHDCTNSLLRKSCEGRFETAIGVGIDNNELQAQRARRRL